MLEYIIMPEFKIIWTILHLIGVAVGAGGAFAADYTFFQSVRDRKITKTEMSFIENSSKMVWLGLFFKIYNQNDNRPDYCHKRSLLSSLSYSQTKKMS
jgi:hypothetical protein